MRVGDIAIDKKTAGYQLAEMTKERDEMQAELERVEAALGSEDQKAEIETVGA